MSNVSVMTSGTSYSSDSTNRAGVPTSRLIRRAVSIDFGDRSTPVSLGTESRPTNGVRADVTLEMNQTLSGDVTYLLRVEGDHLSNKRRIVDEPLDSIDIGACVDVGPIVPIGAIGFTMTVEGHQAARSLTTLPMSIRRILRRAGISDRPAVASIAMTATNTLSGSSLKDSVSASVE